MKRRITLIAFLTLAMAADAIVIDDFTDGSISLHATNYSPGVRADQTNLDPNTIIGGERSLYAGSLGLSRLEIDSTAGVWVFEASKSLGYFEVSYGLMSPLALDLRADGSDAFLLSFSYVYTPGIMSGGSVLRVNGRAYDLRSALSGVNGGPIAISIPSSEFSSGDSFVVDRIQFVGGGIEPTHRFALDSIITIPEPGSGLYLLVAFALMWRHWKPNNRCRQLASAVPV